MEKSFPTHLLWLDLEMTGLEPASDRILEVGAILTDFQFNELASYEAVIRQPQTALGKMKQAEWYDWSDGQRKKKGTVYDQHEASGLLQRVRESKVSEAEAEAKLIEMVAESGQAGYLAGNSIHQDRRFIRQWWPKLEAELHYRMLDVSSFKIWMQGAHHLAYKTRDKHRALDDIRGSIEELKFYLDRLTGSVAS